MSGPDPAELLTACAFPELPELDAGERLARFLTDCWHRRSCLLPGALGGLAVPLDGDELAGLACEPDADARIVRREGERWILESGPFEPERFETLGDRDWTLLVNGVDLFLPGLEPLLERIRFVPDWRLDDVMVSFAAPGGSVGPHFDRYDVFLLQAEGVRRWELGAVPDGDTRPQADADGLRLVRGFVAERVEHCGPGDALYVPPGLVHHGIAETPCLTVSLGLRAPSLGDLAADFARTLAGLGAGAPLDLDPALPTDPARLDRATVDRARAALRGALEAVLADEAAFEAWLGAALTRPGRVELLAPVDPLPPEGLRAALAAGARLERAPGLRLVLQPVADGTALFAGGERFRSALAPEALAPFTRLAPLGPAELADPAALHLAHALYTAGRLELLDDDGDPAAP
ncbi:MAG: cupin domain-containing protein [Pseudomonadales bacterium]|nr:cupin domain-containing protein [Pseudomonadales bacterium]